MMPNPVVWKERWLRRGAPLIIARLRDNASAGIFVWIPFSGFMWKAPSVLSGAIFWRTLLRCHVELQRLC